MKSRKQVKCEVAVGERETIQSLKYSGKKVWSKNRRIELLTASGIDGHAQRVH
jgi:hypothetical protein